MPVPAAPGSTTGSSSKSGTIGTGGGSGVSPNGGRPGGASQSEANAQNNKASAENQDKTNIGTLSVTASKSTPSSTSLRYPHDSPINDNGDYVAFDFYEYNPPFKNDGSTAEFGLASLNKYNASVSTGRSQYTSKQDSLSSIILYMPEDISTGFKANWTGKNFSNVGAGIMRTAGATDLMAGLKNFGEGLNEGVERIASIAGAQLISAAIGKITGESVSLDDVFSSTRGVILNPNTELLFTGLDLRNFTLNYKLVPRSAAEATKIEEIIKTFKRAMLPYANSGAEDLKSAIDVEGFQAGFIKVPDLVQVTFMRGSNVNKNVPQFKMCALTQVDIGYTPDGTYATTEDGRMVAYTLGLNFQETKLILREDIDQGY